MWDSTLGNRKLSGVCECVMGVPGGSAVKNLLASAGNTRDVGSIPGSGRSPGEGNGYPLQYSCLETSMKRGFWQATVHGVTESDMTECAQCMSIRVCVCVCVCVCVPFHIFSILVYHKVLNIVPYAIQ